MSEYCDTCEEHLDWLEGNLDDRDNCVKCQIKAAKIGVLKEVLEKSRQKTAIASAHSQAIEDEIKELEALATATQLGFGVGKAYTHVSDNSCTYHVVSETHYTAVFVDNSEPPSVDLITILGSREDYNVIE